jgi:hypothetical protein
VLLHNVNTHAAPHLPHVDKRHVSACGDGSDGATQPRDEQVARPTTEALKKYTARKSQQMHTNILRSGFAQRAIASATTYASVDSMTRAPARCARSTMVAKIACGATFHQRETPQGTARTGVRTLLPRTPLETSAAPAAGTRR